MPIKSRFPRRAYAAFLHDVLMAGASFLIALYLRLGDGLFDHPPDFLVKGTAAFVLVAAAVFLQQRLYRGIWRYASMNDLMAITRAVTLVVLVFLPVLFLISRAESLPRSALIINWMVLIALLGGSRFVYRVLKDRSLSRVLERSGRARIPVLLIGAGDAAETFIRALARSPDPGYRVVGIVDEKGNRVGRQIHDIRVIGAVNDLPAIIAGLKRGGNAPQRLILTKEHLDGALVRTLLAQAEEMGLTLSRIPRLTDFQSDLNDGPIEVRPIAIEDILGRPQTVLDRDGMQALIAGRRVLITGAGGTIGAELVRQVAALKPARLALFDNSEFNLYSIDGELAETRPELSRKILLGDVRDGDHVARIMAEEAPEIVFHAAALKHVPMVEDNPNEGVLTNVIGTRNVAEACRAVGVAAMVMISTDKAVNPTSVMGATKRIAEAYCQALDVVNGAGATRYITVRFGNVLGSTGSVVPLFQRQLEKGGPLTVTHPDMTRYFMTVREAVELVLQATVAGAENGEKRGRIFVLDMGEPVRITDLAEHMIRLSGLRPGEDIEIVFTGLRPGEKLFEDLFHSAEPPVATERDGVLLASPRVSDYQEVAAGVAELETSGHARNTERTLALIGKLVPEYHPGPQAG